MAVDLGTGCVLFALLKDIERLGILAGSKIRKVPRESRPMLVTFDELGDPTSVALVDPDDLASTFGEGYVLRRITVQMTDDPVTTGIEERLGWLIDPSVMEIRVGVIYPIRFENC